MFSLGENALPNGLDVTFEVTELRRMTGSYNTMVGNNEGSMVSTVMAHVTRYFLKGHILFWIQSLRHTALALIHLFTNFSY